MHIWGKIFGFLFGFMLSKNIVGALLGAWLGHSFDKARSGDFNGLGKEKELERQNCFFYTTFSVMGYIAKANGLVSSQEIAFANAYMDKLNLNTELRQKAQDAFRVGKSSGFDLDAQLSIFKKSCGKRHDLLLLFLEIQIQVAFADGELDNEERIALHNIAKVLGFSAGDLDKLLEMIIAGAEFHQQQANGQQKGGFNRKGALANAYKVLGINKETSEKDSKKAYRKLMSQHHPDKLIAKGLPPEMMEIAKQKTQDIQAAYELIVKSR
jgi:DnaJ like chaperone protein